MRRGGGGQVTPVFLYILPSLVMIWLHTKTQHPMLPGGAFKVCVVVLKVKLVIPLPEPNLK